MQGLFSVLAHLAMLVESKLTKSNSIKVKVSEHSSIEVAHCVLSLCDTMQIVYCNYTVYYCNYTGSTACTIVHSKRETRFQIQCILDNPLGPTRRFRFGNQGNFLFPESHTQ